MPNPNATVNPPMHHLKHVHSVVKQLSGEDKVVVAFSLLSLLFSPALYFLGFPSIMISTLLSAGVVAVVYRFLGGVGDTKFVVGTLKLSGTLAALIGIAYWMNSTDQLDPQRRFHLVSNDVMVGEWQWDAAGKTTDWVGQLSFKNDKGRLTFTGKEYDVAQGSNGKLILELTNGKATVIRGMSLELESDVTDYQYGNKRFFHWKTVAPFPLVPAFWGYLRPQKSDDPTLEMEPYGMLIYKKH